MPGGCYGSQDRCGHGLRERRGPYLYGGGAVTKVGHHEKWQIKIETQGALGIENKITPDDIAGADVVLLVTDIEIDDARRFCGQRTIKTSIKTFLLHPQQIAEAVKSIMKKPVVYLEIP